MAQPLKFYMQYPQDTSYNVTIWSDVENAPYPVIEAQVVDEYTLKFIAPEWIAQSWPRHHSMGFIEVPAELAGRSLTRAQYINLFQAIEFGSPEKIAQAVSEIIQEDKNGA